MTQEKLRFFYTLVHNFCPPLKFQPENEVVGHYAICVSKQSSQYPPLGGESFFQNFGPSAGLFKVKNSSNNPENLDQQDSEARAIIAMN